MEKLFETVKNTVCFKFDVLSLKRKVQLYSRLKKKISFCFSRLTYLFSRFLLAAGCYFDPGIRLLISLNSFPIIKCFSNIYKIY